MAALSAHPIVLVPPPKALNPFEIIHSKKRFNHLGVKDKSAGSGKARPRLRTDAHEDRKRTLLVEYRQLGKANTFQARFYIKDRPTIYHYYLSCVLLSLTLGLQLHNFDAAPIPRPLHPFLPSPKTLLPPVGPPSRIVASASSTKVSRRMSAFSPVSSVSVSARPNRPDSL